MRAHQREVGGPPRLPPDLLAGRTGPGLRLHQRRRQRRGTTVGVAHQPQVRALPLIEIAGPRLGVGQIVRQFRLGQQPVRQPGEHRQLVAARRATAGRHHGGGVPAQHGGRLVDRGDAGEAGGQPVIRGHSC